MTTTNIETAASPKAEAPAAAAPATAPAAPAEPKPAVERPYSPGLQGVIAAETAVGFVDGGRLLDVLHFALIPGDEFLHHSGAVFLRRGADFTAGVLRTNRDEPSGVIEQQLLIQGEKRDAP